MIWIAFDNKTLSSRHGDINILDRQVTGTAPQNLTTAGSCWNYNVPQPVNLGQIGRGTSVRYL
jgi:hypothetical protein